MAAAIIPTTSTNQDILSDKQIFVGNLPITFNVDDLQTHFEIFGILQDHFISIRKGRQRGFGFVTYLNAQDAQRAFKSMNKKMIGGKPLRISFARKRKSERTTLEKLLNQNNKLGKGIPKSKSKSDSNTKEKGTKIDVDAEKTKQNKKKKPVTHPKGSKIIISCETLRALKNIPKAINNKDKTSTPNPFSFQYTFERTSPNPNLNPNSNPSLPSPYLLLSNVYQKRYAFLSLNKKIHPSPVQIKSFIQKTDVMVNEVLEKCIQMYQKPPPPHVIQFLQENFLKLGWLFNYETKISTIVKGSQPPTVVVLIKYCKECITHFNALETNRKVAKR